MSSKTFGLLVLRLLVLFSSDTFMANYVRKGGKRAEKSPQGTVRTLVSVGHFGIGL